MHKGNVSIEANKQMIKNKDGVILSKITMVSDWSYEVMDRFGDMHHFFLNERRCNCKVYDRVKIPCGHALMAADHLSVDSATLAGEWYKTSTWVATYAGVINP